MTKSMKEEEVIEEIDGLEDEVAEDETLNLCFVRYIGSESDGYNCYEFMFSNRIDEVWGENWEHMPAGLVNDLLPDPEYVTEVHILKTKIKFNLAQDNLCYSLQDCIDGGISLCMEDISGYDSYPEDGRLVFHFGESFDEVDRKLAMKNMLLN